MPEHDCAMSSRPAVTLHVGQMKTATTSLQAALHASREPLDRVGIHYHPAVGTSHVREALDLLRQDTSSAAGRSPLMQHTMAAVLADGRPYWADLVRAARADGERTVVSAEDLSLLGPDGVARVAGDLGALPVRVVLTVRPLSAFVVSFYSEVAKKLVVPDPDTMVRRVVTALADDGGEGRFGWMLADRIRRTWEPIATDGCLVVALSPDAMGDYQRAFWQALGIDGVEPPPLPRENRTLPAGALLAWQEHLRATPTRDRRVEGRTVTVLAQVDASTPAAPRSAVRIRPDVAALVDAAFPADGPQAAADVMRALRDRATDPTPLVEFVPQGGGTADLDAETAYWRGVIERKRRAAVRRISVARRLRLRRPDQPDWDGFRDVDPGQEWEFAG
jgi:hypothetical protein